MSFRLGNTVITLENYRQIFKACTPDILDEIRSAVLDDTSIANFIKTCGNDSYKLGQLRMAVRELVPIEYLSSKVTGRTIYNIRQGFNKGSDFSDLLKYYNSSSVSLDPDIIEKLSDFLLLGVDISKIDFTIVPKRLVDITLKGLYKGYPMWLIIDKDCKLSEDEVSLFMRGLSLGVDIHPFLDGTWKPDCILLLFSYAKSNDINEFLQYVNNKFSVGHIEELTNLFSLGHDIRRLCIKDSEGYPVYNSYQIHEIGEAIKSGVVTEQMYNPSLSDMDISVLREQELAKSSKLLSVSLGRKK